MVEEAIRALRANTRIVRIYNPSTKRSSLHGRKRQAGRKLLGLSDREFVALGVANWKAEKEWEIFWKSPTPALNSLLFGSAAVRLE